MYFKIKTRGTRFPYQPRPSLAWHLALLFHPPYELEFSCGTTTNYVKFFRPIFGPLPPSVSLDEWGTGHYQPNLNVTLFLPKLKNIKSDF